jgi:hypothetical protein
MSSSRYLSWLSAALVPPGEGVGTGTGHPHAVFGYATGYVAADLMPFVRSLRACFDGEIVLAVDDRPDIRALFEEYGVTATSALPKGAWAPHPVMERFAAYDVWLAARPWVKQVLLTDVRDVIFQSDPFADPATQLEVFIESEGATLKDHRFDQKYLKALVGPEVAARIDERPCLCVGTVFGPAPAVSRLCKAILLLAAIPRSEIGGIFGADQAACNLAVHLGLVGAEVRANYGRVATIGDRAQPTLREDGLISNPDGSLSPVVHQYDRHKLLADAVRQRWGAPADVVVKGRTKSLGERIQRLSVSFARRMPELR